MAAASGRQPLDLRASNGSFRNGFPRREAVPQFYDPFDGGLDGNYRDYFGRHEDSTDMKASIYVSPRKDRS